jgi:signal transduction histidine kinase
MGTHHHRRLLWLFLAIVFLPCSALLTVGLRIASQERELSERRRLEARDQAVQQLGRDLAGRLETIVREELTHHEDSGRSNHRFSNRATELVAPVVDDRLVLPWDDDRAAEEARRRQREQPYADLVRNGERLESASPLAAAESFRSAMDAAGTSFQRGYARLLRARALRRAGRTSEALGEAREVLELPFTVRDEYGVPLAFYAAESLPAADVVARLAAEEHDTQSLAPAAFFMWRDLLRQAAEKSPFGESLVERIAVEEGRHGRLLSLAEEIGDLWPAWGGRRNEQAAPVWLPWGDPAWMLSVTRPSSTQAFLVAVDAAAVFREFEALPSQPRFSFGRDDTTLSLGSNFPRVSVAFMAASDSGQDGSAALQRSLYWLVVLLVVTLALFGTFVLLHGVRRELRLAELRTQFVSSVSHELKTPLTAIRMFAESLRMGRPEEPEGRAEYLDTIISESERLTRLLNNVLDFSKLERGTTRYQRQSTSLQEVLASAIRAVRHPLSEQGFELRAEIDDSVGPVEADPDAMQQAVLNLLSNAMKYSGEARSIRMGLRAENGDAVIEVTDRGVGIPAREQRRIFEKFYRVPSPLTAQIPGTGLGLTLVEHVATGHGGRVEVESTPGEGSTFRLRLPLEEGR